MRSFTTILASASLLFVTALAVPGYHEGQWNNSGHHGGWNKPSWPSKQPGRDADCMSDADAQGVADNFRESIANYSDALALAAFTADFHD